MSVGILLRAVDVAGDELALFQSSNALSVMDIILLNETQKVLLDLDAILKQYASSLDEQALFDNFKTYLSNRWDEIAGYYLSYTNRPNSTATQLCLNIAKWLHQKDNSKSVYQYLMPTLTATVEALYLFEANIDDLKLSQAILSEDKTSLIPSRLIGYLSLSLNTNFDSLSKPYVQKAGDVPSKLTDKERTALIEHSRLSRTFYKHYDAICAYKENNLSLGGEIYRLIKGLREGGQHGPHGGTADVAADIAYEAIARFMAYWDLLEDDLKDKVKILRANKNSHSLQEIINILIKVDDKSLDCVEVNAEKLELLVKAHPNLYTQGQHNPAFLKKICDEFDELKKQFDVKDSVDGHERCPLGAYCLNFIDADFTTKLKNNDLMGIIKKYNEHAPALVRLICQAPGVLTHEMLLNADSKGLRPLSWAMKYDYIDIVKFILEKTVDVAVINAKNEYDSTLLQWAVWRSHTDIVKLILEKTDDLAIINAKNKDGRTPLLVAASQGHTDIVRLILEKTNDLTVIHAKNVWGQTPLMTAAEHGHTDIVKLFLEKTDGLTIIDAESDYRTVMIAVAKGHVDIVKLILEKTNTLAAVNAQDKDTPLQLAASLGYTDIVRLILEKTHDLAVINRADGNGQTSLLAAAWSGHTDIVKIILEKTEDIAIINARNNFGGTPLLVAAENGHVEVVKLILEKINDLAVINAKNIFDKTPLLLAAGKGYTDIVKLILEKTNDLAVINAKITSGWTPLLLAAGYGHTDIVKLILQKTEDIAIINAKNKFGGTPLLVAALHGHTDIVKLFLEKVDDLAIINTTDKEGKTPLAWAKAEGHIGIAKLIEEKIAGLEAVQANKKPDVSESVLPIANSLKSGKYPQGLLLGNHIDPASVQSLKKGLKKQLRAKNRNDTLKCYSDADVDTIIDTFERQVLRKLSLPNEHIQYINKYPEVAVELLVGVMDASGDLNPPLKPTGLTGLIHAAVNKTKSNDNWGGICSSGPVVNTAVSLYEIDHKKLKHFDKDIVKQFICDTLRGIEYVKERLPISDDIVATVIQLKLYLQYLKTNQPTTQIDVFSTALAREHFFKFSAMEQDCKSLSEDGLKKLAVLMTCVIPLAFNELEPWENDIIQKFPGQWAGIIAGKPILPDNEVVETSWWSKTAQIKFTQLLTFSFSELMITQTLGKKSVFGYAHKPQLDKKTAPLIGRAVASFSDPVLTQIAGQGKPVFGYALKSQAELDKKKDELMVQIVGLTHVACKMLQPLYVEAALRSDLNFDEKEWLGRQKQSNNNSII